ncbi:MAG: FKBP-type peptidyl-prolyl cis-trans isomerase [Flavobacteriales bacterium]|nr:FKBP-type peptidyl-prolyl cis-trans isomerase [Flavobacteriales bacterium]
MNVRHLGTLGLLLALLAACGGSPYPGHKHLGNEVHFRLVALGDGARHPNDSDRIVLAVRATNGTAAPGSLYSSEQVAGAWSMLGSALGPALKRMKEGDSATVWMRAADVPWDKLGAVKDPTDTGMVRLDLALRSVKDMAQVRAEEEAYNAWRADRELEERAMLERYLTTHGVDRKATAWQGIHILPLRQGKGELLRTGDMVTIAYVAHGLDGARYDDTYKAGTPLTFRLGDPGQVIRGLEIGLRRMQRGGKSTFIIPSQFAFGDDGSAGGVVPPFTTVIYDVEVLEEGPADPS